MIENYYKILGINLKDSFHSLPQTGELVAIEEVTRAYKKIIRERHPDTVSKRGGTAKEREDAT